MLDIEVVKVDLAFMNLKHVALVLFTAVEDNMWTKLALVATTGLPFSIQAVEVPVLHEPFFVLLFALLDLSLMLADGLLVLLNDLVKEGVCFSCGLFLLLFVSLLLGLRLSWGLLSLFRLLL